jgi:peptidoglycan/LPS O-acetylase OafA/YrhL
VDLFFVLSGYLVSGLLFKEYQRLGRVSVGRFLVRRGLKIYPAFWVLIAISVVVFWLQGHPVPLRHLLGELFFVQNYAAHMWGHTWSLAIEEHFYLCLALLVWVLLHRPGLRPFAWLPGIFIATAVMCLGLRLWNAARFSDYQYALDLFPTHLRIDSLFFGVLLAYLAHFHRLTGRLQWFPPWGRVAAGAVLLLPAFFFSRETERWVTVTGFNLFYLGSGLIVLGAVHLEETSSRFLRALGGLGAASYSIYLWHLPVNSWFATRILATHAGEPLFYAFYLAVCVFGALLVGYAMARAVELPVLQLRDRLFPPRNPPTEALPPPPAGGMTVQLHRNAPVS